jgi:Bacterial regulatory proteins, tetR family
LRSAQASGRNDSERAGARALVSSSHAAGVSEYDPVLPPARSCDAAGRASVSREAVLAAALRLADEHGLEAVTMHAVAERLRVTPMALYRHVDFAELIRWLRLPLGLPGPAARY